MNPNQDDVYGQTVRDMGRETRVQLRHTFPLAYANDLVKVRKANYGFLTLLIVAGGAFALLGLGWILDRTFLSEFRARAMRQYRKYTFDRLLEKGVQAFSGENSARYLSALSNDANTIEQDYVRML